jgi:hypothetical protein
LRSRIAVTTALTGHGASVVGASITVAVTVKLAGRNFE